MCDSSCVHVSKDLAKAKSYDSDLVFAQILPLYSLLKSLFVERSDESPLLHYVVKIFDRSGGRGAPTGPCYKQKLLPIVSVRLETTFR